MEPKALLETRLDSLDGWAVLFTLLVVLGVGGELVVHIMSSRTSKRLIEIQKAEEQQRQAEIARLPKEAEIARKDIAEAHARAAEANQKAEEEKLARVKIEEKLAPRHLSAEQQRRIVSALKPFA